MRLVVDVRERALVESLSFLMRVPEELDVRALDVGDAQLVADTATHTAEEQEVVVIVERKTLPDLCASIKDGRYREQKARLRDEVARRRPCVAAYVLECFSSFGKGMDDAARRCGMSGDALRTVLLDLQFRQDIRVLCTASVEDTAELLYGMWKRRARLFPPPLEEGERHPHPPASLLYAKRNKNVTPATCFRMQLAQIPGVSERIATSLSEKWPTWTALISDETTRSVETIAAVPKVGKKLAERIHAFLFP